MFVFKDRNLSLGGGLVAGLCVICAMTVSMSADVLRRMSIWSD